ncbi:neurogenic locus notch homolog protein 1-like isoform X2 [Rhopilema esculentum]|uniref:neurogenic locus notch homolog protein 1-like isoform X2 n=1 Tax=Rhopilema esculentum TaxID=499914 RepID=UPI0031D3FEE6
MRLHWIFGFLVLIIVCKVDAARHLRLRKQKILKQRQDVEEENSRQADRGDKNLTKVFDIVHKYRKQKGAGSGLKRHNLGQLSGLEQVHQATDHQNGLNGVPTADVGFSPGAPNVGYLDAAHGVTAALHGQKLQVGGQATPAHLPSEDGLNPLSMYHKDGPDSHITSVPTSINADYNNGFGNHIGNDIHTTDPHVFDSNIVGGHVTDGLPTADHHTADETVAMSPHVATSHESQLLSAEQDGANFLQHQQGVVNIVHPNEDLMHQDVAHNAMHLDAFQGHHDEGHPVILDHHDNHVGVELEHHLSHQTPVEISHPPVHVTQAHHHNSFHEVEDQGSVEYQPCTNGGIFVPTGPHSYECICPEQFIGKNCQDINHCHPCPCKNKGRCHNIIELPKYKCTCLPGYFGQQCEKKDPCHPNPCKNNGKCSHDGNGKIECVCPVRFKGTRCEDLHSCKPNPCLNNGMCTEVDAKGKFECQCTEKFRGTICNKPRFCYQNPCQNGGICQEDHENFNCICNHGWRGRICEERACKPNPCKNGGTCSETADGKDFKCVCLPWHSGRLCEENRPCLTKPCLNGGKCIDSFSGFHWSYGPLQFYCICKPPYTGEKCEVHACRNCHKNAHCEGEKCVCDDGYKGNGRICIKKADPCHPNPCENDGVCVQKGETDEFDCRCKKPYLPPYCKNKDPCDPNPCKNEGQCVPTGDGSYNCICQPGFKGMSCNQQDACIPSPCQHGGTCRDENGTASCECKGMWAKPFCKECGCPKKSMPGVPDITCNQEGKCVCPPGYIMNPIAKMCQKEKKGSGSPCQSNPCVNNGVCMDDGSGGYTCQCPAGFLGKNCQIKDPCNPNPCNNNGKCKSDPKTGKFLKCECPPKFPVLPYCDPKEAPAKGVCEPNPCKNGGRCVKSGQSYDCICLIRYTGPTCNVDKCANCDTNAACVNGRCRCKSGFIGNGYDCIKDVPTCAQKCPQYSTCVIPTGNCQCNQGYTFVDRVCLPLQKPKEDSEETAKEES